MNNTLELIGDNEPQVTFGRRKVRPRVCVIDWKRHIRAFLAESLEELGFIAIQAMPTDDLQTTINAFLPDLLVIGLGERTAEICTTLESLAKWQFAGEILLMGPLAMPAVNAARRLGDKLGLGMLQTLGTPFGLSALKERLGSLLPADSPPAPPVSVSEALHARWLELWYQPKVDAANLNVCGAEALIRIRHPTWGIIRPAYFIPAADDPHFVGLSDFVIGQALADWHYYVHQCGRLQLAINLPLSFFEGPAALDALRRQIPKHPAFEGLIVEISGAEASGNLDFIGDLARRLEIFNVGVSISNVGAEWPMLMTLDDFPFAEIKLSREFVSGCADESLKRSVCRHIIDLADHVGARTIAEGVERLDDFLILRELGVKQIQGFLFAKPMSREKFARGARNLEAEAERKVHGSSRLV